MKKFFSIKAFHPGKSPLILAIICGMLGFILYCYVGGLAIQRSGLSTAPIGFLFLPFYALAVAAPCFIYGYLLGYSVKAFLGRPMQLTLYTLLSSILVVVITGFLIHQIQVSRKVVNEVHAISTMNSNELTTTFNYYEARPVHEYQKFILGAIALNPNASTALLDNMAKIKDDELYQPMGSLLDILGTNTKGLSVMRLVAKNPHVSSNALAHLAQSSKSDVINEVVANPKTSSETINQLWKKWGEDIIWGVAQNPNTSPELLEQFSHYKSQYPTTDLWIKAFVARNPNTPKPVLYQLGKGQDQLILQYLTENPAAPVDLLKELTNNANPTIQKMAEKRLAKDREPLNPN